MIEKHLIHCKFFPAGTMNTPFQDFLAFIFDRASLSSSICSITLNSNLHRLGMLDHYSNPIEIKHFSKKDFQR